jgi:chaperonin GroES
VLPESAREKPVSGEVVRAGRGKQEEDGTVSEMSVAAGDQIVYFKYAGDNMETTDGSKYVVLHEQDILCKT